MESPENGAYDAIVLLVAHDEYRNGGVEKLRAYGSRQSVFYDVKSVFVSCESDLRL